MKISNRDLARAVLEAIDAGQSIEHVTQSLAAYLITERRSKDAELIRRDIETLLETEFKQLELRVTTVNGMDAALQDTVTKLFKGDAKHIIINEEHDPTVVGGVLVESGERRLDLTVRRQLQRLKEMGV